MKSSASEPGLKVTIISVLVDLSQTVHSTDDCACIDVYEILCM